MSSSRTESLKNVGVIPDPVGDAYVFFLFRELRRRWLLLLASAVLAGVAGFGIANLLRPVFTAQAVILPPLQQGGMASALGSLGALIGAGGAAKTTSDQYVAFMQSNRVMDVIIDKFDLMNVFEVKLRADARKVLTLNSKIQVGKRDGLIYIAVDDVDPSRAAAIANAYVDGLRSVTSVLSVTEGKQRRVFFEQQMAQVREKLAEAQGALQSSGFSAEVLKAEPKAAAEAFARAKAELMAAEIKLKSLERSLTKDAPEVSQQSGVVATLRAEFSRLEKKDASAPDVSYIAKYREYRYQEALFDMYAKQFEQARLDESREGSLVQVLDAATPPERKSKPSRLVYALIFAGIGLLASIGRVVYQSNRWVAPAGPVSV